MKITINKDLEFTKEETNHPLFEIVEYSILKTKGKSDIVKYELYSKHGSNLFNFLYLNSIDPKIDEYCRMVHTKYKELESNFNQISDAENAQFKPHSPAKSEL